MEIDDIGFATCSSIHPFGNPCLAHALDNSRAAGFYASFDCRLVRKLADGRSKGAEAIAVELAELEAAIAAMVKATPHLAARAEIIESVPG